MAVSSLRVELAENACLGLPRTTCRRLDVWWRGGKGWVCQPYCWGKTFRHFLLFELPAATTLLSMGWTQVTINHPFLLVAFVTIVPKGVVGPSSLIKPVVLGLNNV